MKHKIIGYRKDKIPAIWTSLSWGFCILYYASFLLKLLTLWISLGTAVILYLAVRRKSGRFGKRMALAGTLGLAGAVAATLLVTFGGGRYERVQGSYAKSVYGAPEKVMVIVPHEDDDLNLAAGVIDSYRAEDTRVLVVYMSNGDYRLGSAYRLREALNCQKKLGGFEDDVIFLGYGDQYDAVCGHLYNAPADELLTSWAGRNRTYGLKGHPEYRQAVSGRGSDYTRTNAIQDMQELLDQERPEVIFCMDQDSHPDHRAASLIFEEAMGNLLRTGAAYRPSVFKGFGYSTSWSAKADYLSFNVPSTKMPYRNGRMKEVNCYLWAERLRFPVLPEDLAYTRRASGLWPAFCAYGSQKVLNKMDRIVNGDKVFWPRRTDSLLYTATFSTGGKGNASLLNDFKLADSNNIAYYKHRPFDGVWSPADGEALTVRLKEHATLHQLVLYDNPSLEDNVLEARITWDNGKNLFTGPLEPGGSATLLDLPAPVRTDSFQIEIVKSEGKRPGLSEVEAYDKPQQQPAILKLTDTEGNFLYTYTPKAKETIRLQLYASAPECKAKASDPEKNFTVTADGAPLKYKDGSFLLPCPDRKTIVHAQLNSDPSVYDEIVVKPYSALKNFWLPCLKALDEIACAFSNYTRFYLAQAENMILKALGFL